MSLLLHLNQYEWNEYVLNETRKKLSQILTDVYF